MPRGHLIQAGPNAIQVETADKRKLSVPKALRKQLQEDVGKSTAADLAGLQVDYEIDDGQLASLSAVEGAEPVQVEDAAQRERRAQARAQRDQQAQRGGRGGRPRESDRRSPEREQPRAPRPTGDTFRNPYNFVPILDRPAQGELADVTPAGHHRYHDGCWTGSIAVTFTAESPMLLNDGLIETADNEGHKTGGVRRGADGLPKVASTSFKGSLRGSFEKLTNSRVGIPEQNRRITHRQKANAALRMVPARIIVNDQIQLLPGTSAIEPRPEVMYAAWLARYRRNRSENFTDVRHGDEVTVRIRRLRHNRGNFERWVVVDLAPGHDVSTLGPGADNERVVTGWASITGDSFPRKHDERVFFTDRPDDLIFPLSMPGRDLKAQWKDLIVDWREVYDSNKDKQGPHDAKPSRHLKIGESEVPLKPGDLVYAQLDQEDLPEALYPVMIGREQYSKSPAELLAARNAGHAESIAHLSPADHVFGWVRDSTPAATNEKAKPEDGVSAWKGKLRVSPIRCALAEGQTASDAIQDFGDDPRDHPALATLNAPKPTSARWYAARDAEGSPFADGHQLPDYVHGLRGAKVYLAHPDHDDSYWTPGERIAPDGTRKEWLHQGLDGKRRTRTNRSVASWVKPGTRFVTTVEVRNLTSVELGALVYLLDGRSGDDTRHLLGGGRPLGFGKIAVEVDWAATRVSRTDVLVDRLGDLDAQAPCEDPGAIETALADFKRVMQAAFPGRGAFEDLPQVVALRRSMTPPGPGDPSAIHYPRNGGRGSAPDPEGRNFEYWVENERLERGRLPNGYALPALHDLDDPGTQPSLTKRERGRR